MSEILWEPRENKIKKTNMLALYEKVFFKQNSNNKDFDYNTLHKWSIDNTEEFWNQVWDDANIIGIKGSQTVNNYDDLIKSKFYPEGQINFAENLLVGEDNREAIVFYDESKVRQSLTLKELKEKVIILAKWLTNNNVNPGDRVAVIATNSPETIISMLATSAIGAIFTSCSPDFGEEGIIDRFGQCTPKILITTNGYIYGGKKYDISAKVKNISERIPSIKKIINIKYINDINIDYDYDWSEILSEKNENEFEFKKFPFNDPLYILYSSGTTGKPKCIIHSAGGTLIQHIKEHRYHCDMHENDRIMYFTTCGWMMWNWMVTALASKVTLVLYEGSPIFPNPLILFEIAEKEKLSFFGASAKYIDSLNKLKIQPNEKNNFEKLRVFASTGSPLSPQSYDWVYSNVKKDLQLSSISGGTDIVACFVQGNPCLPVKRGEIQCSSLGMDVQSWDDSGLRILNLPGELVCINSFPSIPLGFWNDKDNKKFKEAYFEKYKNVWHHGDFVIETKDNSFIIEGRSDSTLNPGGIRIGTAEIYRQVESLEEVKEALAVGQDWKNDQRIILFLILREKIKLNNELKDKIKNCIRDGASPRHVPAKIFMVNDFPRTRSGKISELAVRNIIHNKKLKNIEALMNPEVLELFKNIEGINN
tara:strand:+ start:2135 stop:4078 length:1944 start_codon:yes stop_codon:yes gene_type:complete